MAEKPKCGYCGQTFDRVEDVMDHINKEHNKPQDKPPVNPPYKRRKDR